MNDAELAKIRENGCFDLKLEGEKISLELIVNFALSVFPDAELSEFVITLDPTHQGVRVEVKK